MITCPVCYGNGFNSSGGSCNACKQSGEVSSTDPLYGKDPVVASADELSLWRSGKQMLAIKAYRERTGVKVHDAKEALEAATGEKLPPPVSCNWKGLK